MPRRNSLRRKIKLRKERRVLRKERRIRRKERIRIRKERRIRKITNRKLIITTITQIIISSGREGRRQKGRVGTTENITRINERYILNGWVSLLRLCLVESIIYWGSIFIKFHKKIPNF